jgi:hypothetical protein
MGDGRWEGVGSWELGVESWELGVESERITIHCQLSTVPYFIEGRNLFNLSALVTTDTELNAIAPPASIGSSNQPKTG